MTICLNYHVTEELLKLHDIFIEDGLEVVAFQTTNLNNTVVIKNPGLEDFPKLWNIFKFHQAFHQTFSLRTYP